MTQTSLMAVGALATAVERAGVSRAHFLAEAGLSALSFDDIHVRISDDDYRRAAHAALSTTGDPAFGLHMAERATLSAFDVLGHLSEQSRCLRDALQIGVKYSRIVTDGPQLALDEAGDSATLRITLSSSDCVVTRLVAEFAVAALLHVVRMFMGEAVLPRHAFFHYPEPPHRAEYTRVFGGREQFCHAFSGMELDRAWLDRTQLGRSTELRALLQSRAELLLAKVDHEAPAAERVKRWLASQDVRVRPTMEEIARDLGMSARSLRRRLHYENTPFDALVDDALALRAKRMLADPGRSIQDTAYAMGFGTPSAFSRAFKRWTGQPPSMFRSAL